jgi:hypothetical protein
LVLIGAIPGRYGYTGDKAVIDVVQDRECVRIAFEPDPIGLVLPYQGLAGVYINCPLWKVVGAVGLDVLIVFGDWESSSALCCRSHSALLRPRPPDENAPVGGDGVTSGAGVSISSKVAVG